MSGTADMSGIVAASILVMFLLLYAGNYLGDQGTLLDCANTGQAVMLGGGTIKCDVVKEVK
jgi:hypothetical protein